jgi:Tannase and feruloyl esterase
MRPGTFGLETLQVTRLAITLLLPLIVLGAAREPASDGTNLEVVKPVLACAELSKSDFSPAAGAAVTIKSATVKETAKGQYCTVVGNIQPTIGFEVDLPLQHWTERFLQEGCGGLCGMLATKVDNASQCLPALNGELVVASDDMGHQAAMGSPAEAEFGRDPYKRLDFAYRANHLTALVAKSIIKAYYGRSPRYSYFMGCSDGGREALMEAQRFPDDFDGVSAGDPAALFQVQNSFYHAWNVMADKRPDGTNILMPDKRKLLHDAVLAHCDTLSGVKDGLLQDPRACHFDPAVLECPAGAAADSSGCLTAEELGVVQKLYAGASDGRGHFYTFGALRGGELQWYLPSSPTGDSMSVGMAARSIGYLILPTVSPEEGNVARFSFDDATFTRMAQLAPLYNATNTNLKAFAAHGGKLILWHGLSDTSITPGVSIAYYQGVQKFMGAAETDEFLRLFLLPGVGHCRGGDGYDQVDLLTPLMAWTELGRAPAQLITGKLARADGDPPAGPPAPRGIRPVAPPAPAYVATRPVYPWPSIARYNGKGDTKDATSYGPVRSPAATARLTDNEALSLIGPDNQKSYTVEQGKLIARD